MNTVEKALNLLLESKESGYRIANKTGITEATIGNYRNGKTKPTKANAMVLLQYFSSHTDLMTNDEVDELDKEHLNRQRKVSNNSVNTQEKSDIADKFSVSDLVKAITNLSEAAIINANATMKSAEAAIINAEANNRQSKNMERMLDILSGDIGTYQRKTVVQGCVDMCNTA